MSDVVFGDESPVLTFYGSFTEPADTAGAYSLWWLGCPAGEVTREEIDKHFTGLDGVLSVDGGALPRIFSLVGILIAADGAGLDAGEAAIEAMVDGQCHTLTRFGGTPRTGVNLSKFTPGRFKTTAGGKRLEEIALIFRHL